MKLRFFHSTKQFVLPIFFSQHLHFNFSVKTECLTLSVLAQRINYTHLGAEEDGQLLGGTVGDQHIQTQQQGTGFSVDPTYCPPVTGCILILPREKATAVVEEGKNDQDNNLILHITQIANRVYF